MAQRRGDDQFDSGGGTHSSTSPENQQVTRPSIVQSYSDPKLAYKAPNPAGDMWDEDAASEEFRDTIPGSSSLQSSIILPNNRLYPHSHSFSTTLQSAASSRSSSPFGSLIPGRPSLASSATSMTISVDTPPEPKKNSQSTGVRHPSRLARLRSSISAREAAASSIKPSDFQNLPEQPEKHFIDSIGMVIPGVCDRKPCEHPLAHFITHWRLCEPTEYTTVLADHGVTYSDYSRLISALAHFLDEIPNEPKRRQRSPAPWGSRRRKMSSYDSYSSKSWNGQPLVVSKTVSIAESERQYKIARQQAEDLNRLLEEVTWNWQSRGLPIMVCISSYSLFIPNRISEAHVQLLHVSLDTSAPSEVAKDPLDIARLSFIDPFSVAKSEECSVARPRSNPKRQSLSPHSTLLSSYLHHHQQLQIKDRTRPWPLWPNAIPSRKREQMYDNADRYGMDPFFRAWMRADVNSRTRCTSYAKYMIERENNPFINKRLEYVTPPSREAMIQGLLGMNSSKWIEKSPGSVNRKRYECNRRLECRKTIEQGTRLRLVRFGFRHPLHPPHTPEMEELGLTRDTYNAIVSNIEEIRQSSKPAYYEQLPDFLSSWTKLRRRNTIDALTKVSEYIRQLNASSRRIVWTIEKVPGVYDQGIRRDKQEWEISAWNGEDPLDLLIQLEKWGIIAKGLDIDDDD